MEKLHWLDFDTYFQSIIWARNIHLHIIPFGIVHIVLVDAQLCACQWNAGHLILKRSNIKVSRNHVMQQKLKENTRLNNRIDRNNFGKYCHHVYRYTYTAQQAWIALKFLFGTIRSAQLNQKIFERLIRWCEHRIWTGLVQNRVQAGLFQVFGHRVQTVVLQHIEEFGWRWCGGVDGCAGRWVCVHLCQRTCGSDLLNGRRNAAICVCIVRVCGAQRTCRVNWAWR